MEAFLFGSALKEFLRAKRVLPWLLLAAAAVALGAQWKVLDPHASKDLQYSNVSMILVFRLLALISAVFTTAIVSQEVEQKTIVYLLTRPIARWKLLLFRWLASVTVVWLISAVCTLALSAAVYRNPISNPMLFGDLWALFLGACAYGALFLMVSLMFNRAMIICLLFAFGWETSIPNMPGDIYYASVFSHLQAVAQHPTPPGNASKSLELLTGQLNSNILSASTSMPILLVMIIGLICFAMWWFSSFEYVPREDAE